MALKEIQFYLASSSPRRIEILSKLGFCFATIPPSIHESYDPNEKFIDYAKRIAYEKSQSGLPFRKLMDLPILAADTIVVCENILFGKPKDLKDAVKMLQKLSGRSHTVITAVCLAMSKESYKIRVSKSKVFFSKLTDNDIIAYCNTKEPFDKAGAYAIQGFAASFITRLEGSYTGVMGLPVYETIQLLKEHNIGIFT